MVSEVGLKFCLLDVFQDYLEFKSMCHCVFPRLLDTKLMANTQPFKVTLKFCVKKLQYDLYFSQHFQTTSPLKL